MYTGSRDLNFRLPSIVGHRGVTETGPENTLTAIETAAREGATWVEFDVQLSRDSRPVIFHDDTLNRTTPVQGNLKDRTAADLAKIDAGRWFSPRFEGTKIPNLADAIALCRDLDLGMNIEIKPGLGSPAKTSAEALSDLKKTGWKDWDKILISGFEHDSLVAAFELAPQIPRGYLMHKIPRNWWSLLQSVEATTLHSCYLHLSRHHQEQIQNQAYPIMLYSVDRPGDALALKSRGIDSLCTGTPGLIAKTLTKAGFTL